MQKIVSFWRFGKTKPLSYNTVKARFRCVKSKNDLYDYAKYVDEGGNRNQKLEMVWNYTYKKFSDASNQKLIIHDEDLRRWALEKSRKIGLTNFSAKHSWIHNFKVSYRIVSRKINKMILYREFSEKDNLIESKNKFVDEVKEKSSSYDNSAIFNTDQSGFNLEMYSGRTLATKGVKNVEAVVQHVNALTHSYTIQPVISADGDLLSPMMLVLKEQTGKLGPIVSKNVFRPKNIFIEASTSAKFSKYLMKTWFFFQFLKLNSFFRLNHCSQYFGFSIY